MFGFFVNEDFKGFWSNQVNDKFVDLTIAKMQWPKEQVTVVYYNTLQAVELQHAEASKTEVLVKREVTNQVGVDEATQEPIYETTLELVRTVPADLFMSNGLMVKPC